MHKGHSGTFRLTALWALSESGLGGVMHALQIPLTGFFVGGFAVIIIGLIASMNPGKSNEILKATLLVILVKAAASPHSPFPAYVAVAFQGLCGALVYRIVPHFFSASLLFAVLAMLESALQKLIITTLIFGKSFWDAIDIFFKGLMKDFSFQSDMSFSLGIILIYCGIYLLWGIVLGIWSARMPLIIKKRKEEITGKFKVADLANTALMPAKKRKSSWKLINLILALSFILIVLLISPGEKSRAVYAFFRAAAAMLLLFFFVNPVLLCLLRTFSGKQRKLYQASFDALLVELDDMRKISRYAFQEASRTKKGINRIKEYVVIMLVCSLNPEQIEI